MALSDLRTELLARGGARLESSGTVRQDAYLNRAMQELAEDEEWPQLLATTSGIPTAGALAISDLRTVESVVNTTNLSKLTPLDPRHLLDADVSLTTAGTPTNYYVTSAGISTYPVSTTASITVRYWKVPAALTNGTDVPVFPPARYASLIVDLAMLYVYLDADDFEAAGAIRPIIEEGKARLRKSQLHRQHDRPSRFIINVVDHADA